MREYFLRLFEYDLWANRLILRTITYDKPSNQKVLILASHILSAQIIWLNRILDIPVPSVPLWEAQEAGELETGFEEIHAKWVKMIGIRKPDTFEEIISYTNTKGQTFESVLSDIIIHVANHGTYHRSQIALLLREEGIDPPITDFIHYARLINVK